MKKNILVFIFLCLGIGGLKAQYNLLFYFYGYGAYPQGSLTLSGNKLYGITESISSLSSGFYLYCLNTNNKAQYRGKLVITE